MSNSIRIASGSGFWGDWSNAPIHQVKRGPVDYLVLDYLAEVTMSILQKLKNRDASHGYARDFLRVMDHVLPEIANGELKVLTNAGGVNPRACKDEVIRLAREKGLEDLRIAVVDGDDVRETMQSMMETGETFNHLDARIPFTEIDKTLQSAHAYLGSKPMVEALQQQADVIITGRVIDAGLTVAPMAYEFDWRMDQHDLMAAATVAGHLLECGGQASGGNFTDWEKVEDLHNLGFPIVEAYPDGSFDVTKHEGSGGLVSLPTLKEQLIYEIRDPKAYLTADVSADFTSVHMQQISKDRVRISGVEGSPPPDHYKVSANYLDGYKITASLTYSWPRALEKARDAGRVFRRRIEELNLQIDDLQLDYVGFNACHGQPVEEAAEADHNEIQLRIAARGPDEKDLHRLGKEVAPLILTGPPGATGFAGGRPKPSPVIAFWPTLIDKTKCSPQVNLFNLSDADS